MCQVLSSSAERKQAPKGTHGLSCHGSGGTAPPDGFGLKGIAAKVHNVPRLQSSHGPAWLGAEGQ